MDTGECGAAVREFAGEFEIHLTVVSGSGAGSGPVAGDEGRIRRWAEHHRVKYTRIVLDRGATPDQPMLTVRGVGGLSAQRVAASVWTGRLGAAGFGVARVKIEAAPWNEDVPRSPGRAETVGDGENTGVGVGGVLVGGADQAGVGDGGVTEFQHRDVLLGRMGEVVHEEGRQVPSGRRLGLDPGPVRPYLPGRRARRRARRRRAHRTDTGQRHAEPAQPGHQPRLFQLPGGVVAVAGVRVDPGGPEQLQLVVEPKCLR